MTKQEIYDEQQALYSEINSLRALLRDKDYIGVKIAMGVAQKSDYTEQIAQTEEWRARINAAEARLAELAAAVPDDADEPQMEG